MLPRSGDVLYVTRAASVQFTEPMFFRVIRVHEWSTYDGWIWLDGYQLKNTGEAVERRSIFVQLHGLKRVGATADVRTRNSRHRTVPTGSNQPARRPQTTQMARDNGTNVRSVR